MNEHSGLNPVDPAFAEESLDRTSAINPRYMLGILIRYRWLIVAIVGAAVVIGLVLTLLITPRYTAVASVQIDQQAQRVLQSEETEPVAAYQDADRFLKTQVDVLRSRRLAERVAAELKLFQNNAFLNLMRERVPAATEGNLDALRREAVLLTIARNLNIYLPTDSRVVQISFVSPDAEFSARVANTFARSYIRYNLERRFDSSSYARDFLSRQLADVKQRLEQSERQSNEYARTIGLVPTSGATRMENGKTAPAESITMASLNQLNTALNEARAARIAAQAKWQRIQGARPLAISEVVGNQAIERLLEQRSTANANLQAELARHRDDFPTVPPLRAQVAQIDQQIGSVAADIRGSINNEYQVAAQREAALQAQVGQLKSVTQTERDRSVQLNILNREVDTNRTLYDALLQRFKELSAEAGISSSNVSLIDEANAPSKPSSPNLPINVVLSVLAGLLAAGVVVFLREQVDDRIRRPEDIETKLGLRPLGITPLLPPDVEPFQQLSDPKSELSEAYYALRSALQFSTPNGLPPRLIVSSAQPAEGKSTTSLALARGYAELGKRVLLLDADLRRPSLHRQFGTANDVGLSDLLTGRATVDETIRPSGLRNLSLVTSGPIPPSPTELLSSERLPMALEELSQRFDLVLLDAPPVLGLADVPILAEFAPMLFVIRANIAHHGAAKGSLRRLRANNANILGALFTQFDFAAARAYGYSYGYNYGYGYNYYQYE